MAKPDVGVKLHADGVAQVRAAFRQVQAEAEKTKRKAGKSFGGLNKIVGSLRGQLAGLAAVVSVGAFTALLKNAASTIGQLGELSEGLGTTTESLSALHFQALKNGVSVEKLNKGLVSTAKHVSDMKAGAGISVRAFKALKLSADDFKGKDTAEQFEIIGKAMSRYRASSDKTAIATALYSRSAKDMIPILDEVGRIGLDGVSEKAERLSMLFSEDVVAATDAVGDNLGFMQAQITGLAGQMIMGMEPALTQTFSALQSALGDSSEAWEEFGTIAGSVIKWIAGTAIFLIDGIATAIIVMWTAISEASRGALAFMKGNFREANRIWKEADSKLSGQLKDYAERQKKLWENLNAPPPDLTTAGGTEDADASQLYQDRIAALQAALTAELNLTRLNLRLRTEEERRAFAESEISLREYYKRRQDIARQAAEAEIEVLEQKAAAALEATEQGQGRAEAAKIKGEIDRRRVALQGELVKLTYDELQANRKLADELLGFERQIQQVKGETHAIALAQIEEESERFKKALASDETITKEQKEASLKRFRETMTAGAEFDRRINEFNLQLAGLNTEKRAIREDVEAGLVTELDGEKLIHEEELNRVETLKELLALAGAAAEVTADPEKIARVKDLGVTVQNLGDASLDAKDKLGELSKTIGDELLPVMTDWLDSGIEGAESFGEAMQSMSSSVVSALRRMAAQYLALKALKMLIPGFSGGGRVGFAAGGLLHGPGSGTSDSIPIDASAGEYIIRAAVVRQPGVLEHLEQLNAGLARAEIIGPKYSRQRFADGGIVAGPVEARIGGELTVGLEEGLTIRELETPEGERALIRIVQRNRRAFQAVLG